MGSTIQEYLASLRGKRVAVLGIGVSNTPLIKMLLRADVEVTACDKRQREDFGGQAEELESLGAELRLGPDYLDGLDHDVIFRTPGLRPDVPQLLAARERGSTITSEMEVFFQVCPCKTIAVTGSDGKTTTTSMCTHIFLAAQRDPTVMIGGTLPALGAGHRVGQGDTIILESCEYCNSFLSFFPTVAVILNVDADHLDFFKDLEDVKHSFRRFAELVPQEGCVVADGDDANTMDALRGLERPMLTFGLEQGDIHCEGLTWEGGFPSFDLIVRGEDLGRIELSVPGVHNVRNALAAAGAALQLGAPFSAIRDGLRAFRGAGRRFEHKGEFHGAAVYDDYAHHPGELSALLTTARSLGYRRVICAFQPHTYTRTKELFDQFVQVLQLPDKVLLAEIFAARETDTLGISSRDLAQRIPGAEFCPTLEEVARRLAQLAQPGDLILTVGAGDIYLAGERLLADQ